MLVDFWTCLTTIIDIQIEFNVGQSAEFEKELVCAAHGVDLKSKF